MKNPFWKTHCPSSDYNFEFVHFLPNPNLKFIAETMSIPYCYTKSISIFAHLLKRIQSEFQFYFE